MIHPALVLALALSSGSAMPDMRKCADSTRSGHLVVVDGVVIAHVPRVVLTMSTDDAGERVVTSDVEPVHVEWPPAEEMESAEIVCWEWTDEETGERVRQPVVSVMTKSGLPGLVEAQLGALVEAQEAYFARFGVYASYPSQFGFFDARPRLPIEVTRVAGGWRASVELPGHTRSCHVFGGSLEARSRPELEAGVPRCFDD